MTLKPTVVQETRSWPRREIYNLTEAQLLSAMKSWLSSQGVALPQSAKVSIDYCERENHYLRDHDDPVSGVSIIVELP